MLRDRAVMTTRAILGSIQAYEQQQAVSRLWVYIRSRGYAREAGK